MSERMRLVRWVFALVIAIIVWGCASSEREDNSERYVFDDLEQVERIQNYKLRGWNVIDSRSLILNTGPQTSYLLVLQRDLSDMRFAETLMISSTVGDVRAGFDTVATPIVPQNEVAIVRIYRLRGDADEARVKAQIRGEE